MISHYTNAVSHSCLSISSKIQYHWHFLFESKDNKDDSFPYKGSCSSVQELGMTGEVPESWCLPVCRRLAKQAGDLQVVATVLHRALSLFSSPTCCSSGRFGLGASDKAELLKCITGHTKIQCTTPLLHNLFSSCCSVMFCTSYSA